MKEKEAKFAQEELDRKLKEETIDVTLPSVKARRGSKHPLNRVIEEVEDLFVSMGYDVAEGPELEKMAEETERDVTIQENDMELVIPKEQSEERQWNKEEDDFLLNLDLKEQIQKQVQEQDVHLR